MARPKHPAGNKTPRRYKAGPPRRMVEAHIGKEAYRTLRTLALAAERTPEEEATHLLLNAIERAWQQYDAAITREGGEE